MKSAITEAAIRHRVGEQSFSRGKHYYEQDAIVSPRLEGSTLRAHCWGSEPRPYHLWLQLGVAGIIAGDCSCPVGDGGYCKHAAALLLTWLHTPDVFQEGEPWEQALDTREKADLILLIRQMIARYPDLEELIDLYPAGSSSTMAPANLDLIRSQVNQAFKHGSYGHDHYGASSSIADELESIMQQADNYRERGAWVDAANVYCTVLDELRTAHAEIYDHDGHLNRVLWIGSERLGECLLQVEQPEARLDILRSLVGIITDDIDMGGYGFSDSASNIVVNQATGEEKAEIVSWLEEKVEASKPADFAGTWRLEAYGGLLLDLQEETLSDEQFIDLCRRTGRFHDLLERLLQLERVDEAITTAMAASDYTLLSLADLFVAHGHDQIAEELVWERAGTSNDTRLEEWLKKKAVGSGEWHKAIAYANNQFRRHPRIETYREIKEIAERLGDWAERQQQILSFLTQRDDFTLLTRIHLHENDVKAALATLSQVRYPGELAVEVAQAAEETHPHEAIRLYRENADRLIAGRGRGNYAQAAVYLTRVKKLYKTLEEPALWQATIEAVRSQKPRLPALLEELRRAGL